jgi:hypothetical protein
MKYIEIEKGQEIHLVAKTDTTPTKAIIDAIEFCKKYEVINCCLSYDNYCFGIAADMSEFEINEMIRNYRLYLKENEKLNTLKNGE